MSFVGIWETIQLHVIVCCGSPFIFGVISVLNFKLTYQFIFVLEVESSLIVSTCVKQLIR